MEVRFSPPNLKRIGYPKNTIYMRKSGWFLESHRHSLASKGIKTTNISVHAGGLYRYHLPDKGTISVYANNLNDAKRKLKDSDHDGVPDRYDCSPHDPTKQDYELSPQYDRRKSFYGKAEVRSDDGRLTLRSYNTDVAYIKDGKAVVRGTYPATTLRHIKEFLKQNGFKAETSSQIMKDYGESGSDMKAEEESSDMSMMRTTAMVAKLGEIMGSNIKEKNDWKERMLRAGLENRGLEMPDDWNTLDEKTKEERLNKVIELLKEKGK
jgi:hypothetical protein